MWPLWLIVTVAVGGAVSLTGTAVLTVVHFERRRHRKIMNQHMLNRRTSQMHRHHLSITEVDISGLPRPKKSLRNSYQRSRSNSARFYATVPSQEEIKAFPEGSIADSVINAPYCQPDMNRPLQWLSPTKSRKLKRKKKLAVVSVGIPPARSPMSAITEATEESRKGSPEPVELPANPTPSISPDKPSKIHVPMSIKILQDSRMSMDSVLGLPEQTERRISQRVSHGEPVKSRSISAGSIMPPPDIPLPAVPDVAPHNHQRQASLNRSKSDTSLHRRGILASNQQEIPELPISAPKPASRFSGFRFELSDRGVVSNVAVSSTPNTQRQPSLLETSIQTEKPSFKVPQSATSQIDDPNESFETVGAGAWNFPKPSRFPQPTTPNFSANNSPAGSRSVSMIDYDAICGAGDSLNNSPTKPHDGPLSRPVSAMSMTSADMFRLSVVGGTASQSPRTKGHKRQNCVRIKNLTPIDPRQRLSSQLGRLAEAEEDNDSILLPSPETFGANQSSPAEASPTTMSVIKQPQALSLRVKRPGWVSIKDKNRQARPLPVVSDHTKQNIESSSLFQSVIAESVIRPKSTKTHNAATEMPPTVLEATQTSGLADIIRPATPPTILPNISPQRRRTQIQGPRDAPIPSLRVRTQTRSGSPLRRQSCENDRVNKQHLQQQRERKTSDADLRKSIAMLKSMTLPETLPPHDKESLQDSPVVPVARTPSSRYVDSPNLKVRKNRMRSNTVAGHAGERAQPTYVPYQSPKHRKGTLMNMQTDTPPPIGKFVYSPSSISIWEDDSVKADSPELPSAREFSPITRGGQRQSSPGDEDTPPPESYSPVKSHRDHFDQLSMYSRNVSLHQQHQLNLHSPQIQRGSLWKLQQDADVVTSRALALTTTTNAEKTSSQGTRRVISPKAKLQGFYDNNVPANLRVSTSNATSARTTARGRSQTMSSSNETRPAAQHVTLESGVGLGLKFGDKSMAYTVNEMERDAIGKLR